MRGLDIRVAVTEELPVLAAMLGHEELFADRYRRQIEGRGALLIAWWNKRPVGTVYLWWDEAEEPEVREHLPQVPLFMHFEVVARLRSRGIGTAMMEYAEGWLRAHGFRRVGLGVTLDNTRAQSLYRRRGYTEWPYGTVKSTDEYRIMVKRL